MQEIADIIIIGGGVIGVSIAYHLAQRKAGHVMLLERDSLGSGSTGRSVASIDWLTLHPLAVELYAHSAVFFARCDELLDAPCGFVRTGSIVLAGPEQEDTLATAVTRLQTAGLDTRMISLDKLSELEPGLVLDGVAAASFTAGAGYMDPTLTTQAFASAARQLGVDIRQGHDVTGLQHKKRRITGVETAVGPIQAPVVVVAAGAWSSNLLHTAGIKVPLQPVRHSVVCIRRPSDFGSTHHSLLDLTTGIYARPETGGLTLLGSIDPHIGYDPIDPNEGAGYVHDDYLMWSMERLIQRYPELEASELREGWAGIMTITPDWQPIIGAWPDFPGLYSAVGFSGRGFQISPATGDLLAGLIIGDATESDQVAQFSPSRFTANRSIHTNQESETFGLLG